MNSPRGWIKGIETRFDNTETMERILNPRIAAECNLVAALILEPEHLEEFKLCRRDFLQYETRFMFSLVEKLYAKGVSDIDFGSIHASLTPEEIEEFESYGGMESLASMKASVNPANWESFLQHFLLEDRIWHYYCKGTLPLGPVVYDGTHIPDLLKMFRHTRKDGLESRQMFSADDLDDWLEDYNRQGLRYSEDNGIKRTKIDFTEDFLSRLDVGMEHGIPFDYAFEDVDMQPVAVAPILSDMLMGYKKGTFNMVGGFSSTGKSTWWVGVVMAMMAQGYRVLIISNEEDADRFTLKCLVWILHNVFKENITKRELSKGQLNDAQKLAFAKATKFWRDNNCHNLMQYTEINPSNMTKVKREIKNFAKNGGDFVIFDTFKIDVQDMKNQRSDFALVEDTRMLDELAKQYDLCVCVSVQLAERFHHEDKVITAKHLSNSKQTKEQAESVVFIRSVDKNELNPMHKDYCFPFTKYRDPSTGEMVYQEVKDLDPDKYWKIMFIEKTRSGTNTEDSGLSILFEFDGDYSTFKEAYFCRVRQGVFTK